MILRNEVGDLLLAASLKERTIQNPKTIEAIAILKGLQLCSQLEIPNLVVESDCQSIVQMLNDPAESKSPIGNVIQEIRTLMGNFQTCTPQFCYRQSIKAAHYLARHAWSIDKVVMWHGDTPEFLYQIIWFDKTSCKNSVSK